MTFDASSISASSVPSGARLPNRTAAPASATAMRPFHTSV